MLKHKRYKPQSRKSLKRKAVMAVLSPIITVVAVAICFVVLMVGAEAQAAKSAQGFVDGATIGNQFEIFSSQLALQKSQNDNVKQFAQQMIDDHTAAATKLNTTLASMNTTAPQAPQNLDSKHQKMLDKLKDASSSDFDKLYIKDQVKAHDEAVTLFHDYSKHGDNDALKSFASDTLPTLKEHQEKVDQLKSSI